MPQDDGETPNACPTQRRTQTGGALNTYAAWLLLKEAIPLANDLSYEHRQNPNLHLVSSVSGFRGRENPE